MNCMLNKVKLHGGAEQKRIDPNSMVLFHCNISFVLKYEKKRSLKMRGFPKLSGFREALYPLPLPKYQQHPLIVHFFLELTLLVWFLLHVVTEV